MFRYSITISSYLKHSIGFFIENTIYYIEKITYITYFNFTEPLIVRVLHTSIFMAKTLSHIIQRLFILSFSFCVGNSESLTFQSYNHSFFLLLLFLNICTIFKWSRKKQAKHIFTITDPTFFLFQAFFSQIRGFSMSECLSQT